jgi:hypothetical protein
MFPIIFCLVVPRHDGPKFANAFGVSRRAVSEKGLLSVKEIPVYAKAGDGN